MDNLLHGTSVFAAAYLDDMAIFSETWEDHCKCLKLVLGHIKDTGLTINSKKSDLAKRQISYPGFIIGNGVIPPQLNKVEAIQSSSTPTTRKKVRSLLGLLDGTLGSYLTFPPGFLSWQISPRPQLPIKWSGLSSVRGYSRTWRRCCVERLFWRARTSSSHSSCRQTLGVVLLQHVEGSKGQ